MQQLNNQDKTVTNEINLSKVYLNMYHNLDILNKTH